ncbi:MAG: glycosyltransferase [bacterium]
MLIRCYALSPHARLESSPERRLVCDAPLQSALLGESEWAVLNALRPGVPIDGLLTGLTPEWTDFLDALEARGFLSADYQARAPRIWPSAEVIVPVFGNERGLARCLEALGGQTYPRKRLRVTVVDDASPTPLAGALAGRDCFGLTLRWLRSDRNLGPASARNLAAGTPWNGGEAGGGETPSEVLAFVDSDCVPAPDWLAGLAAVLETPGIDTVGIDTVGIGTTGIDAVGGGVIPLDTSPLLGRYEGACSSLVLGDAPGAAGWLGHRISYLPSCNLAVGREAFERVGGFREGWRTGEDVDFSWRLAGQGLRMFYLPQAVVAHDFRVRWGAFLQRRRVYARSEARLRRHHPGRFKAPLRWSGRAMLGGVCGALLTGSALWLTLSLAAWLIPALRPILPGRHWKKAPGKAGGNIPAPWPLKTRLAASFRSLAAVLVHHGRNTARQSMVLWLVLLSAWPELWPATLSVFSLGAAGDWIARRPGLTPNPRQPRLTPPEFLAGYTGEILAYSLGRIEGMAQGMAQGMLARFRRGVRAAGRYLNKG